MGRVRAKAWKWFHRQASSSQTIGTASASKDTEEPLTATEHNITHSDEAPVLVLNTESADLDRQTSKPAKSANDILWEEAYTQFAARDPQLAEHYRLLLANATSVPASFDVADHAQAVLKQKLDQILEKEWKFQFRNRSITLRSKVDQIVKILSIFKDLGSSLAALDPVHAGLPWAGLCFLIAPALNNDEQHNAAIEGINKVAFIVSRYGNFVNEYLDEQSERHDTVASQFDSDYSSAVRKLYDLILTYQASAACYFNRATLVRISRNTIKLDDWKGMLSKIVAMDVECMNYPQLCMRFKDNRIQTEMMDLLTRQEKNWSDLCAVQQTQEVTQTIKQISNISVEQDHEDVRSRLGSPYWDSGQWLLQHSDYLAWEQSSKTFLWLRGPLGVGKSCLASIVIQTAVWKADEEQVLFFYCSQPQIETVDMFRSLLAQLSVDKRGQLSSSIPKQDIGRRRLSLQECYNLIIDIASQCLGVTIIVDAIDECADSDECVSCLTSLYTECEGIKIFVTSRLNVQIDDAIQDLRIITHLETLSDMKKYINKELGLPARRNKSGMTSKQANLFELLLDRRAQGMFRWVELELDIMLSKRYPIMHPKDVQSKLEGLLKSTGDGQLSRAYSEIYKMNTQDQDYRSNLAIKSLQWVYRSYQNLPLEFLVQAVALDEQGLVDPVIDDKFVLTICSNFVIVTRSGEVRFAHRSVKEFLKSSMSDAFEEDKMHDAIASSCLTFLLTLSGNPKWSGLPLDNNEEVVDLELTSFETYACLHWPFHFEATQPPSLYSRPGRSSLQLSHRFLEPLGNDSGGSMAFHKWLGFLRLYFDGKQLLDDDKQQRLVDAMSRPANAWFTACIWGLWPLYEEDEEMTIPASITQLNDRGRSPLVLACVNGRKHTVKLILEVQKMLKADQIGILIQAAARSGDLETLAETLSYRGISSYRAINAAPGVYGRSLNAALSSHKGDLSAAILFMNGAEVWLPATSTNPPKDSLKSVTKARIAVNDTNTIAESNLEMPSLESPYASKSIEDRVLGLLRDANGLRTRLLIAFEMAFMCVHFDQLKSIWTESEAPASTRAERDRAVIEDAPSMFSKPTEFGAKIVRCPFCFLICIKDDPQERTYHLIEDLRPYMCINSTCEIYGKLLGSREEWRTHLLANHNILEDLKGIDAGSLAGFTTRCPLCKKTVEGPQADLKMIDEHLGPHMEHSVIELMEHCEDEGENLEGRFNPNEIDSSRSGRNSARSWSSLESSSGSDKAAADRDSNKSRTSSPASVPRSEGEE